jgi:hypothetical protein
MRWVIAHRMIALDFEFGIRPDDDGTGARRYSRRREIT